jgi:hypothetical protein
VLCFAATDTIIIFDSDFNPFADLQVGSCTSRPCKRLAHEPFRVSLYFNPSTKLTWSRFCLQAEGRAHRLGQQQTVMVYQVRMLIGNPRWQMVPADNVIVCTSKKLRAWR